ncbi:hypothetical protein K491DRAFT_697119 [Lophiostoma macrostomum CBS 122681]|uniref:Zn(2)-C6 fungal-type domain-containing protein n=1 Tax=Lophiostoma macrostomum CBS 122681 TaxID=1314788 RepID=A0A6A6SS46_9PLEO|nr:hypothetical protein K491DRAFT_697119 [Lophiostoma macrostomum CBS 122681]
MAAWPAPGERETPDIAQGTTGPQPRRKSCTNCRSRKAKCDREKPCSSCVRAGYPTTCVYLPGRGRSAKRPRPANNEDVMDSLSRLEDIVRHLETQRLPRSRGNLDSATPLPKESSSPYAGSERSSSNNATSPTSLEQNLGRLVIDETRSYYVSNVLWASLSSEIEELRNMLVEPAFESETYDNGDQTGSLGSNAAILGFRALTHSLQPFHLPLSQSVALVRIFTENVLPLVHIFHMPTTNHLYWDAIASLDTLDKNMEALIFSIYYSALISIDEQQCFALFNTSRKTMLTKFRFVVEQAIARANLLNTQSMILLQAVVLYLSVLRNEDDSRTAWSLTSLVFHIAQSMGLHRDGTAFGLKPLEIELRRRLWYHICLLDSQASEYHGYEPIVHEFGFDTRLPLHINDADLTPEMTNPPPERDEACEMTFTLIRCESNRIIRKFSQVAPSPGIPGRSVDRGAIEDKEALIEELKIKLQHYSGYCDDSIPFQMLSSAVARLIMARSWLVVHFPLVQTNLTTVDTELRDKLFSTSIDVLELSCLLSGNKDIHKWTWHSKTHIQWHAVAFVLSEISSRPPDPQCDRAWGYVCTVYESWNLKDGESKGTLSRPIKRLMTKARYVREVQRMDQHVAMHSGDASMMNSPSGSGFVSQSSSRDPRIPGAPSAGDSAPGPAPGSGIGPMDTLISQNIGVDSLSPYPELFMSQWNNNMHGALQDIDLDIPPVHANSWM